MGFFDNARFVLEVLDAIEVESATLVGHSWAGGVALRVAQEHPERVDALVLAASVGPASLNWVDRLLAMPLAGEALLEGGVRHVEELDREEHDALVQRLEVLEGVQQRMRRGLRGGGQVDRRSRHAQRRLEKQRLQEGSERHGLGAQPLDQDLASAPPCGHHQEDRRSDDQREPAAVADLQQRGGKEGQVDDHEEAGGQEAEEERIAPAEADHEEGKQRVDEHRRRHGDAVRAGEP